MWHSHLSVGAPLQTLLGSLQRSLRPCRSFFC